MFLGKRKMQTKTATGLGKIQLFIKKCHVCGKVMESNQEIKRCTCCNKSFLPLRYFQKLEQSSTSEFEDMFSFSDDLHPEDLIIGINVLW